jgi:hypothetical protein
MNEITLAMIVAGRGVRWHLEKFPDAPSFVESGLRVGPTGRPTRAMQFSRSVFTGWCPVDESDLCVSAYMGLSDHTWGHPGGLATVRLPNIEN